MSDSDLFSSDWYRVKGLRPWLASDVLAVRHVYRGKPCYVLQRESTGTNFRVDISTYELIQALAGQQSVDSVWHQALARYGDNAPSQVEFLELLADLHHAELISVGRRLNTETLFTRQHENDWKDRLQRFSNPLFIRFSLFDPDRVLTNIQPMFVKVFTRTALYVWLVFMFCITILLLPDLKHLIKAVDRSTFTSPTTLFTALFAWPCLKLLHEFAHGVAVKNWGGEVREMGVAVLVLLPIPYVDASASAVFPNKWHRIVVSFAGIFMDLSVAALALLLWSVSGGLIADIALVVVLIAGVSTIAFNGNPLLKFDAYYVLSDFIEVPNLSERSHRYIREKFSYRLFRLPTQIVPVDFREVWWLWGYGVLAFIYRIGLTIFIAWTLSAKYFLVGILLAAYAIIFSIIWPFVKSVFRLWATPTVSRTRISVFTMAIPVVIALLVGFVPVSSVNTVYGVVWLPEDSIVRVKSDCEISKVHVSNGANVVAGDALFECDNPVVDQNALVLLAERDQLNAEQSGLLVTNQMKYQQLNTELNANNTRLIDAFDRRESLTIQAASAGKFLVEGEYELAGQLISAGTLAAYVIPDNNARTVRISLSESTVDSNLKWRNIVVRAIGAAGVEKSHPTQVTHRSAAATLMVPSAALTTLGGGNLKASVVEQQVQLDNPAYDIELAWPVTAAPMPVGAKVLVKLTGDLETLGAQWLRQLQRVLLGHTRA